MSCQAKQYQPLFAVADIIHDTLQNSRLIQQGGQCYQSANNPHLHSLALFIF